MKSIQSLTKIIAHELRRYFLRKWVRNNNGLVKSHFEEKQTQVLKRDQVNEAQLFSFRTLSAICTFLFIASSFSVSYADDVEDIENLFKEEGSSAERRSRRRARKRSQERDANKEEAKKLENLNDLQTFEDLAVIQKRYLPKTGRFEAHISAATNVNDDYFTAYGLNGSLGYNFTEKLGVEVQLKWFDVSNSGAANDLLERNIVTDGMVGTELYYGIDLKWSPIYGKFSYFDKKIIPFDHYFSVGIGQTQTVTGASSDSSLNVEDTDDTALTLHLGTGQIFAITKWMAFRWDVSWHIYENKSPIVRDGLTTLSGSGEEELFSNLFISFGLSFFFPEANYR